MILKINIQSLLVPFQGLSFIPDENSMKTQSRFTQFSSYGWYMIMVYLSGTISMNFLIFLKIL